ncbi:uncharacterized protein [Leptinotarsa decemlineata]|uniref:uncharacterized protein n=1 Tax=Leptinotarsa decemlineata TaxID=7539 RepID=UPI000C254C56|nr:uncharacterized protein LOC111518217 [Leptinotarsa decemlineata]
MALFRFLWLRRLIRSNTNPIPMDKAATWKKRLSVAYMLLSWNAFGLVAYLCYTGKSDWAKYYGLKSEEELNMSPAYQWAKTLGIKNPNVYRIQGFHIHKVEENTKETEEQTV